MMGVDNLMYGQWISGVIGLSLVGVLVVTMFVKAKRLVKKLSYYESLPGYNDYSFIYGNIHLLPKTPEGRLKWRLENLTRFNGKYHRFWLGPVTPIITVYHPETVKKVLQSSAPKPRGFGSVYEMALAWIGEGLIATNGERWARSRRLLTPAFHFDILKDYMQVYNEAADNLFKKLDKLAETGESFNLCPLITQCTLEVILKCALGYDADIQGAGHPYSKAVQELTHVWSERSRRPWLWPHWIFRLTSMGKSFTKNCDYVHKLAEEVIEQRRESVEQHGVPKGRRLDFIDILLTAKDEDGNTMTPLEMRNEVDTFMFAGHDTTASAIPWCLYTLAQAQEYQEKIQEEVDTILEGRDSDEILWDDLPHLKTLALCGKEAMRLYTPVPFIQRILNEDIEFDGRQMPSGSMVIIAIYMLHRNPAVWDEPNEFRPERFLVQNKKELDSFAFTPFSAGSRNCIGQNFALNEEKVVISRILRRYKVQLAKDHDLPMQEAAAVLRSENGIWLSLQKR